MDGREATYWMPHYYTKRLATRITIDDIQSMALQYPSGVLNGYITSPPHTSKDLSTRNLARVKRSPVRARV